MDRSETGNLFVFHPVHGGQMNLWSLTRVAWAFSRRGGVEAILGFDGRARRGSSRTVGQSQAGLLWGVAIVLLGVLILSDSVRAEQESLAPNKLDEIKTALAWEKRCAPSFCMLARAGLGKRLGDDVAPDTVGYRLILSDSSDEDELNIFVFREDGAPIYFGWLTLAQRDPSSAEDFEKEARLPVELICSEDSCRGDVQLDEPLSDGGSVRLHLTSALAIFFMYGESEARGPRGYSMMSLETLREAAGEVGRPLQRQPPSEVNSSTES
ncbi:MAG: hypothetical protein P8M78_00360 [Myxococcota bacterium]|nr:hypothetical protein [Myxococcota bacterium]